MNETGGAAQGDRVKRFDAPDIENFGEGSVGYFEFGWMRYLWTKLEAGKSWIVGLDDPEVVVIAVLEGKVEVRDEGGELLETVSADQIFATRKNRTVTALDNSRLLSAPLVDLETAARSGGSEGGPIIIRGGPIII